MGCNKITDITGFQHLTNLQILDISVYYNKSIIEHIPFYNRKGYIL